MKKVVIALSLIIILCPLVSLAYSFTEYPLLLSEDRVYGCNVIFNLDSSTYYLTTNIPTQLKGSYGSYSFSLGNDYKVYVLENDMWTTFTPQNLGVTDNMLYIGLPEILCSDVAVMSDDSLCDFYPNSNVPATNWQQLQLQEQKAINTKLDTQAQEQHLIKLCLIYILVILLVLFFYAIIRTLFKFMGSVINSITGGGEY